MNVMVIMDQIIEFFNHPVWMLFWGLFFWFVLLWSNARNKGKAKGFLFDQKDEIAVALIGGIVFLLFTESVMMIWDLIWSNETPTEFQDFYYLLVGPAIERIYKIRNNGKNT